MILKQPSALPVRDIDPNVRQRQASDPASSIWVTASAGTGKTTVLTNRILRLLLPQPDGMVGGPPSKILAITFTKAGAQEMSLRLSKILSEWAVIAETDLVKRLRDLLGRIPAHNEIEASRRLFAQISDEPGGMKIMTIHSFCQSVLGRFPLEAGITPNFKALEEHEATSLLLQATNLVIENDDPVIAKAFSQIAQTINEEQFFKLIKNIASERGQFTKILKKNSNTDDLIEKQKDPDIILKNACLLDKAHEKNIRISIKILQEHGTKTDQERAEKISNWIEKIQEERIGTFNDYTKAYLTKEEKILAKLAGSDASRAFPEITEILTVEAQRILNVKDQINEARSRILTKNLMLIGQKILEEYETAKNQIGALDFNDLILKTIELFNKSTSWVLYKLDQGIDHLLIDEAQDTNPEQWELIEKLSEEFTSGINAHESNRTLFVVGDEKQSIYSFQRASPDEFFRMHDQFRKKFENAKMAWNDVPLNISFRTTQTALDIVDTVFSTPELNKSLSKNEIKHLSFRTGQAGLVEIWPVCKDTETEELDPWNSPLTISEGSSGATKLAGMIAEKIRSWIDHEEKLPSRNRPIKPGDIMILFRTRNAFFNQVSKALKDKKIPVSGIDRMILNEQIVIQDLLAFAEFSLQPHDDLTLAVILKSSLLGMDEQALYDLAYNRNASLWQTLNQSHHHDVRDYLKKIINLSRNVTPFSFFNFLLHDTCPANRKSGLQAIRERLGDDATDPVEEFINSVQTFESSDIPSLQQFLHQQKSKIIEIKREMNSAGDFVRLMTIHGAKGLEAPIVILPDTMRIQRGSPSQPERRLLWPNKSALKMPLWSPRSDMSFKIFEEKLDAIDERLDEEYQRLLYVAMTRAEDRLYIGGYRGKREPLRDSWYFSIKSGLESIEQTELLPDGGLRLNNPQIKPADRTQKPSEKEKINESLPAWLMTPAPEEESQIKSSQPSHQLDSESKAISPLKNQNEHRFRRGNLTHKLLEILPAISETNRKISAENYLTRFASDLSQNIRNDIISETLKILENPEFAPAFGPGSLAEVPITGILDDGSAMNGRIDRLLITENEILIVDYKTNRPPPQNAKDVPLIYRKQMQLYVEILKKIYPDKTTSCALLWTDGPRLMPIQL